MNGYDKNSSLMQDVFEIFKTLSFLQIVGLVTVSISIHILGILAAISPFEFLFRNPKLLTVIAVSISFKMAAAYFLGLISVVILTLFQELSEVVIAKYNKRKRKVIVDASSDFHYWISLWSSRIIIFVILYSFNFQLIITMVVLYIFRKHIEKLGKWICLWVPEESGIEAENDNKYYNTHLIRSIRICTTCLVLGTLYLIGILHVEKLKNGQYLQFKTADIMVSAVPIFYTSDGILVYQKNEDFLFIQSDTILISGYSD